MRAVLLAAAAACARGFEHAGPAAVDWSGFGFSLNGVLTDAMSVSTATLDEGVYGAPDLREYGPLKIDPAATVLNYGQGLFEGMKAQRREDGSIVLFRPEMNYARCLAGCERLCMVAPTYEQYMEAVESVVCANARWVPPLGEGQLYLRPTLFGSGPAMGVAPSPAYTFCVYATPVGNYFKSGTGAIKPIKLRATTNYRRAVMGGAGNVKSVSNYAPCFLAQKQAKAAGYADCLFLSPLASGDCVEEAGASNFFVLKGKQLRTPGLGTILPGVTRDSVIRLAKDMGYEVVEGGVEFDSLQGADECFCCGTGASVTPIGAIDVEGAPGRAVTFGEDKGATAGPFTMAVSDRLEAIRTGADTSAVGDGWAHVVAPRAPVAGVYDGPPRVGDAGRR